MAEFDWRTVATAIASGVEGYQAQRALRQQRDDILQGQIAAAAEQAEADRRVRETVANLRTSRPEPIVERNLPDYAAAVRRTRARDNPSLPQNLGGTRYATDVAAANQAGVGYGDRMSNLVASIEAPVMQRREEGETAARAGVDIRGFADRATTANYLAQLRAQRRQPNQLVMLLARIAQQAARNYEPEQPSGGAVAAPGATMGDMFAPPPFAEYPLYRPSAGPPPYPEYPLYRPGGR